MSDSLTRFFGVDWNIVAPGYFAMLGIPLTAGRDFTAGDRLGTELVAIVGEAGARQFWPGQDPIGHSVVQQEFGPKRPNASAAKTLRVVGVARDIRACWSDFSSACARSIQVSSVRMKF